MENYYGVPAHMINVRMVCNHAIDQRLDRGFVLDMMSYLYGVYEDIAMYGNDRQTREAATAEMYNYDKAVTRLDEAWDYDAELQVMSYRVPPGLFTAHPDGGSPQFAPLTPDSSFIDAPLSPPPLLRLHAFTGDVEYFPSPVYIPTPGPTTPDGTLSLVHQTIGTILADTDDEDDSDYEYALEDDDISAWSVCDNHSVCRRLVF